MEKPTPQEVKIDPETLASLPRYNENAETPTTAAATAATTAPAQPQRPQRQPRERRQGKKNTGNVSNSGSGSDSDINGGPSEATPSSTDGHGNSNTANNMEGTHSQQQKGMEDKAQGSGRDLSKVPDEELTPEQLKRREENRLRRKLRRERAKAARTATTHGQPRPGQSPTSTTSVPATTSSTASLNGSHASSNSLPRSRSSKMVLIDTVAGTGDLDDLGGFGRKHESVDERRSRLTRMERAVRELLECIGEDASRPGLLATPRRVAKALDFMTRGYTQVPARVISDAIFPEDHDDMVIVKV